ncbi:MAG TPA: hypothetical protein G4N96_04985 [Chloroflexi bacterium]|nr:hypothetical protein [Chloroflexota bacterium]
MKPKTAIKNRIIELNRQLQKYKDQQARLGVHTPPHVLIEIEDLELGIERLQAELEALDDSATPLKHRPSILVIGNDLRWLTDIVAEVAATFGYQITTCRPVELIKQIETFDLDGYKIAVIDLPAPNVFTDVFSLGVWLDLIAKISALMPIILLTSQAAQQIKILTRHSLADPNTVIVDTIDTDYYDHQRLIKAFKKAMK